jgi:hypothetical protein
LKSVQRNMLSVIFYKQDKVEFKNAL